MTEHELAECPKCFKLKELNAELLDTLDTLLCRIAVNEGDVGIISDPYTIKAIRAAEAAVRKANGEE